MIFGHGFDSRRLHQKNFIPVFIDRDFYEIFMHGETFNMNNDKQLHCPKCGSDELTIQAVTDVKTKHRGCFGWAMWILLAICTFGLILIIPLLTNSKTKTKTTTQAVCQNCGHRWKV